ncbi:MAG: serine hydrolase domain-containing protein [Hyphomonadaceae bacterium]|nr:serine hydrolase domain-containing protein [Hyphomonadaceae bacterium]
MAAFEGYVAPGFERVAEVFAAQIETGDDLGAGFAAIRNGEPIIEIWGGWRDRNKTTPWTQDTLPPVFSTSKGVSSIVVAWCVEHGFLRYEDKVADIWPEFGVHGKDQLTIAQAVSHQAGVPGFPDPIDAELWLDPPACAAAIAALAPLWTPGTASGYHPLTWGYIVGEVVARAAKRSLGSILREEICAPSHIDFHIGLPDEAHARIPEMQKPRKPGHFGEITAPRRVAFFTPWSAAKRSDPRWPRIEIPSANGHGTALAIAQLYDVFATGGEICGRRILSPNTFVQLTATRMEGPDLVLPFNLEWRSGVMGNKLLKYGPNRAASGHSGSGGSCGMGDPAARVAIGYVMNKQSEYLTGDPRAVKLIEAFYACL